MVFYRRITCLKSELSGSAGVNWQSQCSIEPYISKYEIPENKFQNQMPMIFLKRLISCIYAALLVSCLAFTSCGQEQSSAGAKLIWSDEFNYNGLPDSSKWAYDVGGHGWGNNEKQFYLERSLENSFVENGTLSITALKKDYQNLNYTSAKLTTYNKFSIQYGKIEIMAKIPVGKGSWPAIWMLPDSYREKAEPWPLCGEIDIMEHVGKNPNVIHTSLHSDLYNHIIGTQITHFEKLPDVSESFHKYGIEWTEKYIKFYIDDKLFFKSFKGQDGRVTTNTGWPFDKPYYLILNLAIGGNWGGEIDDSIFPSVMQIDYVRIYKRTD
jgi:beta-glucanase (GH16 family)